ncbi:MAG: signal peptidase I [Egibacteraceae bacterium]
MSHSFGLERWGVEDGSVGDLAVPLGVIRASRSRLYRPLAGTAVRPPDLVRLDRQQAQAKTAGDHGKVKGSRPGLAEVPRMAVVALLLTVLIKTFLLQAYFIPSESMMPTLDPRDRVLVDKVTYRFRAPERGEVIVFHRPSPTEGRPEPGLSIALHRVLATLGFVRADGQVDFIKRIIGLPGDEVEVVDGGVIINGARLSEPYAEPETRDSPRVTVPPGRYFMMGDNRMNSLDSRFGLGFVRRDRIVGRAFVVFWPPTSATFSLRG